MRYPRSFLLTLLFTLTACDGGSTDSAHTEPATERLPEPLVAAPVVDHKVPGEPDNAGAAGSDAAAVWEKTRELTGEMVEQGRHYGESALDSSREMYQSAKEKGGEIGSAIGEKSASTWNRTKEIAGDLVEQSKAIGAEVQEQAKELYEQSTRDDPPAEVREL
jgi:polyhydroxyalkanoate synthesis regulator phasin